MGRESQVEAVTMLLNYGCGDVQDVHGEFALDLAIRLGKVAETQMLQECSAVRPASDPTSLMDRRIRLESGVVGSSSAAGSALAASKKVKRKPKSGKTKSASMCFETGRVLDCKQDMWGTRFEVQFDCTEEDMPRKKTGCCGCCSSKPIDDGMPRY